MFDSLSQLLDLINKQPSFLFELNYFANLNIQLYQKNKKHKYLYSNDFLAKCTSIEKGVDIISQTDADLCWSAQAETMQQNDLKVMHEAKPLLFFESAARPGGVIVNGLSYKVPIFSKSKKILGVTGLSFEFSSLVSRPMLHIDLESFEKISFFSKLDPLFNLSERQKECLYYLCRGLTFKKIAQILGISSRTVEHHIEFAKTKLSCFSRTHLIEKILRLVNKSID